MPALTLVEMKRTGPSPITTWKPPVCQLLNPPTNSGGCVAFCAMAYDVIFHNRLNH